MFADAERVAKSWAQGNTCSGSELWFRRSELLPQLCHRPPGSFLSKPRKRGHTFACIKWSLPGAFPYPWRILLGSLHNACKIIQVCDNGSLNKYLKHNRCLRICTFIQEKSHSFKGKKKYFFLVIITVVPWSESLCKKQYTTSPTGLTTHKAAIYLPNWLPNKYLRSWFFP